MRSLWLEEALAGEEAAPVLEGTERADVCIVGGGYTGLWAALRLKELEPSIDVALIEADVCGGGASGRNGGFVLSLWPKFHALCEQGSTEDALWLARSSAEGIGAIGAFCAEHGIEAGFRQAGWLWAATNAAQVGSWTATVDDLARLGEHPFAEVGPEEAAARTGSARHRGGVLEPGCAVVQPALLARGLRRVAMERGVRVFEGSPMVGLDDRRPAGHDGPGLEVRTTRGSVAARQAILAMNAWAIRFAEIRSRVLVIGSDVLATEPIPERLAEMGWDSGMSISDSRLLVHYYRTSEDGRIAFGKGGRQLAFGGSVGERFEGPSRSPRDLEAAFRWTYPELADVRVVSTWTGPVDRSRTGLPFFGPLRAHPAVLYGVGYSGNGVGPSYLGGRILASLALEREDRWASCSLAGRPRFRFPPEPIRFVGGSAVRAAIARAERAMDRERRPNPLDVGLLRLAPSGLVPMKERGD